MLYYSDPARKLVLTHMLYGDYLPQQQSPKTDYWLLDDEMLESTDEAADGGVFIRSSGTPDLIKFEREMEALSVEKQDDTLFLNKEIGVVEEYSNISAVELVKPTAVKAEGIFLRSDLDDWVSV